VVTLRLGKLEPEQSAETEARRSRNVQKWRKINVLSQIWN